MTRFLFRTFVFGAAVAVALTQAASSQSIRVKHVLLISVDGMHDVDLLNFARTHPNSTLAKLRQAGVEYTSAEAPAPSDSYPGVLALVTGGSPRTTGVMYDEFYDRAVSPPNAAGCDTIGSEVKFQQSIDRDPKAVDGGGIDPAKLARDPKKSCKPLYPHDYLRVNTIFEVVKARGGRTAWSDKHLGYEGVNGPSGKGVDDLYIPEIASNDFGATVEKTEGYDDLKVRAVINEIRGLDHAGVAQTGMPVVFGMNFQAVTTAQTKAPNGYTNALGAMSPGLTGAFEHTDAAIGQMLSELARTGDAASTAIILTAKHGQGPIDPALRRNVANTVVPDIINKVGPNLIAKEIQGDGQIIWLTDRTKTAAVVAALDAASKSAGFDRIYSGDALAKMLNSPDKDSRAPDIAIRQTPGIAYTRLPTTGIAGHGGWGKDARSVVLLVNAPGLAAGANADSVSSTQVAPTILKLLGIDPTQLKAVQLEGTRPLPGL
jgi:hypothetical protein